MKSLYYLFSIFSIIVFSNVTYAVTYNELLEEIGHISNERKTLEEVKIENNKSLKATDWFTQSKVYLSLGVNLSPNIKANPLFLNTLNTSDPIESKDIFKNKIIGGHIALGFSPFDKKFLRSFRTEIIYDKSWVNQNEPNSIIVSDKPLDFTGDYNTIKFGLIEYYDIFLFRHLYLSFGFGVHKSKNDFLCTACTDLGTPESASYDDTQLSNHIQLSLFKGYLYTEYARYYDINSKSLEENRIDVGLRIPIN